MSSVAHVVQNHHVWSADDLLRYVKELSEDFTGGTEERISWFTIKTTAEALRMFWDALEKEEETQKFFTLQLRYDCDYVTYTFTFRRPGTTHKHFRQSLMAELLEEKFGGIYNALKFGAPPHGGCAPGIDRIIMLLADEPNLREIVAFPMNQQAQDLLMQAPNSVSEQQLRDLHIQLRLKPTPQAVR